MADDAQTTTPDPSSAQTVDPERAAALAGIQPATFRSLMSRLNGTPSDLRAPRTPGARARRYDVAKLEAWIEAGKPIPEAADADASEVRATASHGEWQWVGVAEHPQVRVSASTLQALRRALQAAAAATLHVPQRSVAVSLSIEPPAVAAADLARRKEAKEAARKAHLAISESTRAAAVSLQAEGLTQADIAEILDLTQQAVQQILS